MYRYINARVKNINNSTNELRVVEEVEEYIGNVLFTRRVVQKFGGGRI